MSRTPSLAYFWPGISQFWGRDVRSGLIVAVGFSILLNLTLVCTFVWTDLLGIWFRNAAWTVISITWVGWASLAYTWDRKYGATIASGLTDSLFEKAQKYYLESNWFEAERVVRKLLRHDRRDIDGRFLLATLLRHTDRPLEAEEELDRIERMDGAEKWSLELQRERDALRRLGEEAGLDDPEDAQALSPDEDIATSEQMENPELGDTAEKKKLNNTDVAA